MFIFSSKKTRRRETDLISTITSVNTDSLKLSRNARTPGVPKRLLSPEKPTRRTPARSVKIGIEYTEPSSRKSLVVKAKTPAKAKIFDDLSSSNSSPATGRRLRNMSAEMTLDELSSESPRRSERIKKK